VVVAGAELVLVADRGGGGGDLAALHEVAVVADLVVAELVVAELVVAALHEVAVASPSGWRCSGDLAELHAVAVVAGRVVAELVVVAALAELRVVAELAVAALHEVARQSATLPTSPRSTTHGGERSRWR
jgi:hypothetical protein